MNKGDTNTDTCCLGANFSIINLTRQVAEVFSYDSNAKPTENVPIASGATAYNFPMTHKTWILIINEALYYGPKLDHSLLNPNQLRHYGIKFWDNPFDKDHHLSNEVNDELSIPLKMKGTKICFESRVPTQHELDTCEAVELTSAREWNPDKVVLGEVLSLAPHSWKQTVKSIATDLRVPPNHHYVDPRDGRIELDQVHSLLTCGDRTVHEVRFDPDTNRSAYTLHNCTDQGIFHMSYHGSIWFKK